MPPDKALVDFVWIVTAAILVFFMQLGFALLESGLVRAKNAVNVILKNYSDMCVGGLGYWAIGYSLQFGLSNGYFGTGKLFYAGTGPGSDWEYSYLFFQMMFSATAATIVSGALAERIRFTAYLSGSFLITTFIYPVYGGWAWNPDGWLNKMGFLDFAGSSVVHSVGAWCSLAGILALGPRVGRYGKDGTAREIPGHNQPFVAMGGLILWFGWFGFNAGSTTTADGGIGRIALNTHMAGIAGATGTIILRAIRGQPQFMSAVVNGSLGGLVAVTAPCRYITPDSAILIGLVASLLVPVGNWVLERLRLDDAVGAIPVHGFCGIWGVLSVSIFKLPDTAGGSFLVQLTGVVAAMVFVLPTAFFMYIMISFLMPLRVGTVDEQRGLDFAEHNEIGYPEFQDALMHGGTNAPAIEDTPPPAKPILARKG